MAFCTFPYSSCHLRVLFAEVTCFRTSRVCCPTCQGGCSLGTRCRLGRLCVLSLSRLLGGNPPNPTGALHLKLKGVENENHLVGRKLGRLRGEVERLTVEPILIKDPPVSRQLPQPSKEFLVFRSVVAAAAPGKRVQVPAEELLQPCRGLGPGRSNLWALCRYVSQLNWLQDRTSHVDAALRGQRVLQHLLRLCENAGSKCG
mmetsp:Transcript_11355/g.32704  ORF Transcript_11355/g.32704 Transcript_11355/m.32704 type:complete len:202 (+) Transcript_11355:2136-2741(+)